MAKQTSKFREHFNTFEDLFNKVISLGLIEIPETIENKELYSVNLKHLTEFEFNTWLQDAKGLEYGNEEQYKQLLTKENWLDFMKAEGKTIEININSGSFWGFVVGIKMIDYFKERGVYVMPLHNFELLKEARQQLLEGEKQKIIEGRKQEGVETTDYDLHLIRCELLKKELCWIEKLSQKERAISDNIELTKYRDYVQSELSVSQQQPEPVKSDKVEKELHNHIFKDNAFEIWQSMFDSFQITESSGTDLRFMYEVMKYNKQIHDTITVKNITDWINDVYDFAIDRLFYTSIKSKANAKRMNIYNLIK